MFDDVISFQPLPRRAIALTAAASIAVLTGCSTLSGPGAPTATTSSTAEDTVIADDVAVLEDENLEAALAHLAEDVEKEFGATVSLAVVDGKQDFLAGADGSAQHSIEELLDSFDSEVETDEAFGMSTWKVKDQARFASHLGCIPEAEYVYDAMSDIVDWQKWGLSGLDGVHSKGGWGLDEDDGEYTSRQIGVMPVDGGEIGIAVSASWQTWDDDNSYLEDSGYDAVEDISAAALDEIASRLEILIEKALETGELDPVNDCSETSRLAPVATESSADSIEEPAQESGD